jgi:hypothetical protein
MGVAIPPGRLSYLGHIGGIFFGKVMRMNVSSDCSGIRDIVHHSRIDILRHEVGEGLQQGFLGMRASDESNDRSHSHSGTSHPWFPSTNFYITHNVIRQGSDLASLLAFCLGPRGMPEIRISQQIYA